MEKIIKVLGTGCAKCKTTYDRVAKVLADTNNTAILKKEEDIYKPLKFSLAGKKEGTHETIGRRYVNVEKALLHMFNNFNENACIRNRYNNLEEVIKKLYREGRSA